MLSRELTFRGKSSSVYESCRWSVLEEKKKKERMVMNEDICSDMCREKGEVRLAGWSICNLEPRSQDWGDRDLYLKLDGMLDFGLCTMCIKIKCLTIILRGGSAIH